jgi:hypothetical protein
MLAKRVLRAAGLVLTSLGAFALVALLSASSSEEPEPEQLTCDRVSLIIPEGLGTTWANPEEAIMATEWLDAIGVPPSAQVIQAELSAPHGIVDVSTRAPDGSTTHGFSGDTASEILYRVLVDSETMAEVVVGEDDSNEFYVTAIAHC